MIKLRTFLLVCAMLAGLVCASLLSAPGRADGGPNHQVLNNNYGVSGGRADSAASCESARMAKSRNCLPCRRATRLISKCNHTPLGPSGPSIEKLFSGRFTITWNVKFSPAIGFIISP